MKRLRNKETGQVFETIQPVLGGDGMSIAELNEKWEDYKERKALGWRIDEYNEPEEIGFGFSLEELEYLKEIGLWFETKEEAEKAIEKLRAYKRLKDKGFKFVGWKNGKLEYPDYVSFDCEDYKGCAKDLDIVFGGEE